MTREEAEACAFLIWGPKVELCRVSHQNRDHRFVIAFGSFRRYPMGPPEPIILGSGPDWSAAIDHARSTENGKMAEEEHKKGLHLAKEASKAKTPLEFADKVLEMAVSEAAEKGMPASTIDVLKKKFTAARKRIEDK